MTDVESRNTEMDMKHLQFYCGPYVLLLPLNSIMEIGQYTDVLFIRENSAIRKDFANWRSQEIPYIDLRDLLKIEHANSVHPLHVLILKNQDNNTATAMIAIDDIDKTVSIQEHQWHSINGINSEIDYFFDRIYPEPSTGKLIFRLANSRRWITRLPDRDNGVTDAN